MPGTLYLVATPIGNLKDMSLRAVDVLREVDVIACEDTRHSRKLLNHFSIANKLVSYHEHNEADRAAELISMISAGKSVAVISDAGTPGISDPGFLLVQRARDAGAAVVPIPGPVAFVCAAIASGLPTDSIYFGGFLPSKQGERRRRLAEVANIPATLVFYEAPHRIARSLNDCLEVLGDRKSAVARELTKLHEEIASGTLSELVAKYAAHPTKGEMVVVIGRVDPASAKPVSEHSIDQRIALLEANGLSPKAALKQAAKEFGLSKSEAYRMVKIKSEKEIPRKSKKVER